MPTDYGVCHFVCQVPHFGIVRETHPTRTWQPWQVYDYGDGWQGRTHT